MKSFFDVLISYGRADSKAFAIKLHARLLAVGLKVWFDQNDIPFGVDYQNQIDDGIEKAHNFIFIITPHSVKSAYCRKEIDIAVKRNKRIIPLLLINADEFMSQTHPIIGKINWILFQEGIDDFEASFSSLISSIHHQADYVKQHTWFLAKALDWERNQKQTSYLLIGEERVQAESWLKIRFEDEQPPCIPTDLHCEYISESTKNANNLLTQVFISHSAKDRDITEKISKTLMRENFTIWRPDTDIQTGLEFQQAINQGIEGADNVVYLLSPNSLQSSHCQQELKYAAALNKRLICLLIESIDSSQIPSQLRTLQFIDFRDYKNEAVYSIIAAQLLKELQQDKRYYEEHKILLVKSLKWLNQNRNRSILLRGHNLQYYKNWLNVSRQRIEHPPVQLHQEFITESINQLTVASVEVFVSYSRADSDLARKLNEALQLQGKTTWFDQESIPPGSDFKQEIYLGIESSDNFLFIISPRSVNSPYCADEVEYAQKLNKRIVTVLYQEVSLKDLHLVLAQIQWIDFRRYDGDFNVNFSELIRTLDTDREHVKSHTKWSQRALEWKEKERSADLLLRGSEFAIAQSWLQEAEQHKKQPAATVLQKEYITASWNAIAVARKQEKRQALILRSLLGLVSSALVVAVGASVVAFSLWKQTEKLLEGQIKALSQSSETFRNSNQGFDALLVGIKAAKPLLEKQLKVQPKIRSKVVAALQGAVYQVRERNRLEGHHALVLNVSFSPDGKTIGTASADRTAKLWSTDGKEIQSFKGHDNWVYSVSFSPDGKTIATSSADKTAKLWNLDGRELRTLKGHDSWVYDVSFSPDGKTIATASVDKTAKLWSFDGRELKTLKGHDQPVRSARFSPDGKIIATAGEDNTVKLWNLDGTELQTLKGHNGQVYRVSFSPDSKTLATASKDNTVKLWSFDSKGLQTLKGHDKAVWSVGFSPDGKMIVTGSEDNTAKVWSLDGRVLKTLKGHHNRVSSVSFSPDGKIITTASFDNTVKLWSIDGRELQTLKGHNERVNSVSFSPNSKLIATASNDKTAKLWTLDGRELKTFRGHTKEVWSVSFSPDGKMIATASFDETVKLWNIDGTQLRTIKGHDNNHVYSVSFSPDGKMIATASEDNTAKLWSLDGRQLQTLRGHGSDVWSVSFSPDGKTIATASGDNTAKLWSLDGQQLQTLRGHGGKVYSVSFSPDGKTIATASQDTSTILWNLDLTLDDLGQIGCDWVGDYLKHNPHVEESDRKLCDGVGTRE